jgi:hypothetical protein
MDIQFLSIKIDTVLSLYKKAFNHEREACEVRVDANNASPQ